MDPLFVEELCVYWTDQFGDAEAGRRYGRVEADMMGRFERVLERSENRLASMRPVEAGWEAAMKALPQLKFKPRFLAQLGAMLLDRWRMCRPQNGAEFFQIVSKELEKKETPRLQTRVCKLYDDERYLKLALAYQTSKLGPQISRWYQTVHPEPQYNGPEEYASVIRLREENAGLLTDWLGDCFGPMLRQELLREVRELPDVEEWWSATELAYQLAAKFTRDTDEEMTD